MYIFALCIVHVYFILHWFIQSACFVSSSRIECIVVHRCPRNCSICLLLLAVVISSISVVQEGKESESAFRRHFESQTKLYGKNICFNLVNQKGAELALVHAYTQYCSTVNSPMIRLINWDFHHECRKMKFENVNKLIDMVKPETDNM